jgi:hypothetical protein
MRVFNIMVVSTAGPAQSIRAARANAAGPRRVP